MTESEKKAWVEAARRGDEQAFEQIFRHYQVSLFNMALRLVRDPDEAEDVVQKTFIKAFRSISRLRDPGGLGGWLRRTVYTTSIDTLRKRKQLAEYPLDDRLRQHTKQAFDPVQDALFQEQFDVIERALEQMSPYYRACIVLREFDHLSYKEVADVLGKSVSAIRIAIFRARQQLQELLPASRGG